MENRQENELNILQGIQNQISSFDNKAGILVTLIGIIFTLSLNFLDLFSKYNLSNITCLEKSKFIWLFVIFSLYLVSFLVAIISLLLVIIPRTHKSKKINVNYYKDISNMCYEDFKINRDNYFSENEILFNQIKINANICKRKHVFLKIGIFDSIAFSIFMIALIVLSVFI